MNQSLNKIYGKKNVKLIWLVGEIIQIIAMTMGTIILLWLYAPYSILAKIIISIIATYITFDVFKNFVYVRWILMKTEEENEWTY